MLRRALTLRLQLPTDAGPPASWAASLAALCQSAATSNGRRGTALSERFFRQAADILRVDRAAHYRTIRDGDKSSGAPSHPTADAEAMLRQRAGEVLLRGREPPREGQRAASQLFLDFIQDYTSRSATVGLALQCIVEMKLLDLPRPVEAFTTVLRSPAVLGLDPSLHWSLLAELRRELPDPESYGALVRETAVACGKAGLWQSALGLTRPRSLSEIVQKLIDGGSWVAACHIVERAVANVDELVAPGTPDAMAVFSAFTYAARDAFARRREQAAVDGAVIFDACSVALDRTTRGGSIPSGSGSSSSSSSSRSGDAALPSDGALSRMLTTCPAARWAEASALLGRVAGSAAVTQRTGSYRASTARALLVLQRAGRWSDVLSCFAQLPPPSASAALAVTLTTLAQQGRWIDAAVLWHRGNVRLSSGAPDAFANEAMLRVATSGAGALFRAFFNGDRVPQDVLDAEAARCRALMPVITALVGRPLAGRLRWHESGMARAAAAVALASSWATAAALFFDHVRSAEAAALTSRRTTDLLLHVVGCAAAEGGCGDARAALKPMVSHLLSRLRASSEASAPVAGSIDGWRRIASAAGVLSLAGADPADVFTPRVLQRLSAEHPAVHDAVIATFVEVVAHGPCRASQQKTATAAAAGSDPPMPWDGPAAGRVMHPNSWSMALSGLSVLLRSAPASHPLLGEDAVQRAMATATTDNDISSDDERLQPSTVLRTQTLMQLTKLPHRDLEFLMEHLL